MEKDLFSLLDNRYSSLSKTFKIIASYVRNNYKSVPFMSIKELTVKTGVSTASITRFAQELGFSGYIDFQKEIQKLLQKEISPMKQMREFISTSTYRDNILKQTLEQNIEMLEATYSEDLYSSFIEAADLISRSTKVYVVGLRSSYTTAYYLSFMLKRVLDHVDLISLGTGDFFDGLSSVKKDDLLIAVSFNKYSKYTMQVVDYFQRKGNRIIAITDSQSSPAAIKADVTLLAKSDSTSYSFVSALAICNALIIQLGLKDKERTLKTMQDKDDIAMDYELYIQ